MDKIKIYFLPFIIGAFIAYLISYTSAQETQRQMEWMHYQQLQKETLFHLQFMEKDINNSIEDIRNQLEGLYHEIDMLRRDKGETHTEAGNIGD